MRIHENVDGKSGRNFTRGRVGQVRCARWSGINGGDVRLPGTRYQDEPAGIDRSDIFVGTFKRTIAGNFIETSRHRCVVGGIYPDSVNSELTRSVNCDRKRKRDPIIESHHRYPIRNGNDTLYR